MKQWKKVPDGSGVLKIDVYNLVSLKVSEQGTQKHKSS